MARGIWKGTLGFGLVSIGVELYTAESAKSLDLDMLDRRDHAPIGYRKYNKHTGKEVEGEEIVKGYAVSKGRYVILSNEDLKAANPKATQSIDVLGFVPAADIDLVYFDKPYVIGPLKGSEKAYALFVRTLEEMQRVGLAQVVIRTKQHPAAIYPWQGALVAQLLRYDDEVRKPGELGVTPPEREIRPQELTMAQQLVEMMATEWNPAQFHDTYRDDVLKLIEERAAHPEGVAVAASVRSDDEPPRVLDLMAALKGSLAARAQEKVVKRSRVAAASAKPPRKSAATETRPKAKAVATKQAVETSADAATPAAKKRRRA
jgi:DNA end-binding protein Ku